MFAEGVHRKTLGDRSIWKKTLDYFKFHKIEGGLKHLFPWRTWNDQILKEEISSGQRTLKKYEAQEEQWSLKTNAFVNMGRGNVTLRK